MQDPETFLNQLGVQVNCCVNPSRPAVLDSLHRVFVGYESFFFSDAAAREKFLSNIPRYCGRLTDPVTRERFVPTVQTPTARHNGRLYMFASEASHSLFAAMPEMYHLPNHKMLPKALENADSSASYEGDTAGG